MSRLRRDGGYRPDHVTRGPKLEGFSWGGKSSRNGFGDFSIADDSGFVDILTVDTHVS